MASWGCVRGTKSGLTTQQPTHSHAGHCRLVNICWPAKIFVTLLVVVEVVSSNSSLEIIIQQCGSVACGISRILGDEVLKKQSYLNQPPLHFTSDELTNHIPMFGH